MTILPWVESPEHALGVHEAERRTSSHVSNLDALPCVQVVPRELRVLLNRAGWVKNYFQLGLPNVHKM